jgi:hypothetical protein
VSDLTAILIALMILVTIGGGLYALARHANKLHRITVEETKQFISTYALEQPAIDRVEGVVEGLAVQMAKTQIITPAPRVGEHPRKEGRMEALKVTVNSPGEREWFVCEKHGDLVFTLESEKPPEWIDHSKRQHDIPDSWSAVPCGDDAFAQKYQVFACDGLEPSFFGAASVLRALDRGKVLFALKREQQITIWTLHRSMSNTKFEGSFKYLERALKTALSLCTASGGVKEQG